MTAEQFAYWLQGFHELNGGNPPTYEQWKSIGEHLQAVFKKVTPAVQPLSQIVWQKQICTAQTQAGLISC